MATPTKYSDLEVPPLDFLIREKIHEDNRKILEAEQKRFRPLTWWERFRLNRFVRHLQKELRRGGYNQLIIERARLWEVYKARREQLEKAAFADDAARRAAIREFKQLCSRGRELNRRISELREIHEIYSHYLSWLEYESSHRKELIAEERREKKIRQAMRKEARWLEKLLLDVWRRTPGCHHIYKDAHGREKTRTPRFERCSIQPDAHWFWVAASRRLPVVGYRWLLPYGVNIANLTDEKTIKNMCAATGRQVDAVWSTSGKLIIRVSRLDSPDSLPRLVMWRDSREYYPRDKHERLPYTIGISEGRKWQWLDFASDPHVLVAGKSQSGKSNLINAMIATLVSTHSPDEVRLVMIDQKGGMEFTHWVELPHLLWDVAKTVDHVQPYLIRIVDVMRQRMQKLTQIRAKDISAYNLRVDAENRLPRILVVFDELNTVIGLGKLTEEIHNLLMLIVSQGRAVGVHMIASTQHPEVKVIPGRIKTNMAVRLSGAMPSVVASQIVLDSPAAARLPNIPGRFVCAVGLREVTVQAPRIEDSDIAHIVGEARLKYADTSDQLKELTPELDQSADIPVWNEDRVLRAVIEWADGHLSGQKLHKMLGNESPGERHLVSMCKRLIARAEALGRIEHAGTSYRVVKVRKGYYLQSDESDQAREPA